MISSQSAPAKYPSTQQREIVRAIDDLAALIGRTPLIEIRYRLDGQPHRVFAKYEVMNLTGSVKDRMALHIMHRGYETGELRSGSMIVEASSGNTGISFSAIGRALGHPVRIYMPNWMSPERVQLMQNFGAEVVPVSREQDGFLGAIRMAEDFAKSRPDVFQPRQFDNTANIEAHETMTGPEIEQQLTAFHRRADAFIAGVGTGGTVMGVGRYLRRSGKVRVHPLEPGNSPTLRTGCKVGKHRIQGISDEFIPSILNLSELDEVIDVWDGDAILMAQAMGSVLGLGVGISSGANVIGAMRVAQELGPEACVVTVLADSNKKYLSTDLCREEPKGDGYWTPRVNLESFRAVR